MIPTDTLVTSQNGPSPSQLNQDGILEQTGAGTTSQNEGDALREQVASDGTETPRPRR